MEKHTKNKNKRPRLSIDLEPYQDVRIMLEDARKATGQSQTDLTITSLRRQLRGVVADVHKKTAEFAEKYKSQINSNSVTADEKNRALDRAAKTAAGELKKKKSERPSPETKTP